jgi:hypothetical protein
MTTQIPHFIGGRRTAGESTGDVFNPRSGIKDGAEFVIPTMK